MERARLDQLAELGGWRVGESVEATGADPVLPTPWPVGEIAAVALAQAGAAASTIGFALMRVDGVSMLRTSAENPWVGRYRCADDRWIHLHGGFPPLVARLAALLELPSDSDATTIGSAVGAWMSGPLEEAVARQRGCAAIIRTEQEWQAHPHGKLVSSWPTVVISEVAGAASLSRWEPSPQRPLDGLRVLDLTRVLAGPTCGRTLAAFGADVLHVRGPQVPFVPAFVIDTGHGKRQVHCDMTDPDQLATLRQVAIDADVVVQGYRPGVVARYGLDESSLRAAGFGGVFGSVSAYGHEGPWSDRAGWEQLAQSTSGLCLNPLGDAPPTMLPCAATDYTTGFALAAGVMGALDAALADGVARRVEASLCQTAAWILRAGRRDDNATGFRIGARRGHLGCDDVEHLDLPRHEVGVDRLAGEEGGPHRGSTRRWLTGRSPPHPHRPLTDPLDSSWSCMTFAPVRSGRVARQWRSGRRRPRTGVSCSCEVETCRSSER